MNTISNTIKETMQELQDSGIDELVGSYNPEDKNVAGENLFTIYLNSKTGFKKVDYFLDAGYIFQPQQVMPESLAALYENIFLRKENFNIENIIEYKNKLFKTQFPSNSYWALMLPIKDRFSIFELLYKPEDIFVTESFNIVEDIFSAGTMTFGSIEEWKIFNRATKNMFKYLINENKITVPDIEKLISPKVKELYASQVFIYYNYQMEADQTNINLHTTTTTQIERLVELKNPEDELNKLKTKLIKYHFENKLDIKNSPLVINKI